MHKVLLVILIVFCGSVFAQKPSVQIILDVSGSMWLNLESGETKIDAARTMLIDFINSLESESVNMGLRLYGATVSGIDAEACTDSQLSIPINGFNKSSLINTLITTDPKGGTPIVYALNEAIRDFKTIRRRDYRQKLIILVTDGVESCGEDLTAVVREVKASGIELQVIGVGLNERAIRNFEKVGVFVSKPSVPSPGLLTIVNDVQCGDGTISHLANILPSYSDNQEFAVIREATINSSFSASRSLTEGLTDEEALQVWIEAREDYAHGIKQMADFIGNYSSFDGVTPKFTKSSAEYIRNLEAGNGIITGYSAVNGTVLGVTSYTYILSLHGLAFTNMLIDCYEEALQ